MFRYLLLTILLFSKAYTLNYDAEINRIVHSYLKYIKKNSGIYPFGVGGGSLGEVSRISLDLKCCKRLDLDEARYLFIESSSELVKRINQDKTIRPHLHNFPFVLDNGINFILSFVDKNDRPVPKNYISTITLVKGKVLYLVYDYSIENFIEYYKEPYEEALKIYSQKVLASKR